MNFKIFKLHFNSYVHFGNNSLNQSMMTFTADSLFSAFMIEAKNESTEMMNLLYNDVINNKLKFSDLFLYDDTDMYLPKPMFHFERNVEEIIDTDKNNDKKQYKKLKYIPITEFNNFCHQKFNKPAIVNEKVSKIMVNDLIIKNNIADENTKPYQIGAYKFAENSGLYFVMQYDNSVNIDNIIRLLNNISLMGIGGKKSIGFGKFIVEEVNNDNKNYTEFEKLFDLNNKNKYITISISLPNENEIESALLNANYNLIRKGGFVDTIYNEINIVKKKEKYLIASGGVFDEIYNGDVYDVSFDTEHKVFRYGIPMFVGINVGE